MSRLVMLAVAAALSSLAASAIGALPVLSALPAPWAPPPLPETLGAGERRVLAPEVVGDLRARVELGLEAGAVAELLLGEARVRIGADAVEAQGPAGDVKGSGARTAAADGVAKLEIRLRSDAIEVRERGETLLFLRGERPFGGGEAAIAAEHGAVTVRAAELLPLPWFDDVRLDGLALEKRAELCTLPLDAFSLEDEPARIDPVYRVKVVDGGVFTVAVAGVRPEAAETPLLEQALAYAQIRPVLRFAVVRDDFQAAPEPLREGEPIARGREHTWLRVDALIGVVEVPPTCIVLDATTDRLLNRSAVGGPPAAGLHTRIPEETNELRVRLVVPGMPAVEKTLSVKPP